jgi:peptidoglycan/LPS O-acetylase OafA/YrhL
MKSRQDIKEMLDRGWFRVIRRRAATWVVAIAAVAVATISIAGLPTWPVMGVAVLAVATAVNTLASRLHADRLLCLGCSKDLTGKPAGTYGVICEHCGAINQPYITDPAERKGMPGGDDLV